MVEFISQGVDLQLYREVAALMVGITKLNVEKAGEVAQ